MEIHLLPMGTRFACDGGKYVKSGPLRAAVRPDFLRALD